MSGSQHRGDHDVGFYEARIGHTYERVTAGAATPIHVNDDADGPLPPARYLIQLYNPSAATVVLWVGFSRFEKGVAAGSVAGAGPARIPLVQGGLVAVETHVLQGEDDRITLETVGGTATALVTRVSSLIGKGYTP